MARKHETVLSAVAGVDSSLYWDFKPGQPVMTSDGFPGVVTAVQDGPFPGNEQYIVTLDQGLGGGEYSSGELSPVATTTASTTVTAADDYPELGTVLVDRPDIALNTVLGSKTAEVTHDVVVNEDRLLPKACSHCGADGSMVFESSVENTGRGFRATCSNCHGMMVTSGHGMWNPALPSAKNQPSTAPSQQFLGSQSPTCPNCRGDMEPDYFKSDEYRCPDCGVSGKPQSRAEALPERYRAANLLVQAALGDSEFGFHFTAAWSDVRNKAKRIRTEGGVRITTATEGSVAGEVKGDHHIYEAQIQHVPGRKAVATWACACKWGAYAWGRSPAYKRFEGRMCSHALALQFEAQSRGMFGRQVTEDAQRPSWMRAHTPVVVHHNRETGQDSTRRAVPPGNMRRTFSALDVEGVYDDDSLDLEHPPVVAMAEDMVDAGVDPAQIVHAATLLGYDNDDAKALLGLGIEAAKPHHKKHHRRVKHQPCLGAGCRGCNGYGWIPGGWGGWGGGYGYYGPYGGGVGNPQSADSVSTDGGGDGGGGGAEASLHSQGGAVQPPANLENPGSAGFLSEADPWGHFDMPIKVVPDGTYASLHTEAANPADEAKRGEGEHSECYMPYYTYKGKGAAQGRVEKDREWAAGGSGEQVYVKRGNEHHVDWHHCGGQKTSALDESMFEPDPTSQEQFAQGVAQEYNHLAAAEAILEDEPEPALPIAEADEDEPKTASIVEADTTEGIVAAFQATAKHLDGPSGSKDSSDIAEAAREALTKMALKEFTPAEQQAIISEGADVRAANLDRLDIKGTHYEAVLAATAAEEAADDEWMA